MKIKYYKNKYAYRFGDKNGNIIPLYSIPYPNNDDFSQYIKTEKEFFSEYPHLKYSTELTTEITFLLSLGSRFGRSDKESWIDSENILVLRSLPLRRHIKDAENFAIAIEHFLANNLLESYQNTKHLFDKYTYFKKNNF